MDNRLAAIIEEEARLWALAGFSCNDGDDLYLTICDVGCKTPAGRAEWDADPESRYVFALSIAEAIA